MALERARIVQSDDVQTRDVDAADMITIRVPQLDTTRTCSSSPDCVNMLLAYLQYRQASAMAPDDFSTWLFIFEQL